MADFCYLTQKANYSGIEPLELEKPNSRGFTMASYKEKLGRLAFLVKIWDQNDGYPNLFC